MTIVWKAVAGEEPEFIVELPQWAVKATVWIDVSQYSEGEEPYGLAYHRGDGEPVYKKFYSWAALLEHIRGMEFGNV